MFQTLSLFSILLSFSIGIIIGLAIHLFFGFPRSESGFKKVCVALLFAPIIGKSVFLFGNKSADGTLEGVVVAPLLFSILGTLVVSFLIKRYKAVQES